MFSDIVSYVLLGVPLLYAFYKWFTKNENYFLIRDIKFIKTRFLSGDISAMLVGRYDVKEFFDSIYYRYPKEKIIGMFDIREPVYFVRDPELIQHIAIKYFDCFEDHRALINTECDTLFGKSLPMLEGKDWRDMRWTLSPAFTGSKMRQMFELIVDCSDDMTKTLMADAKNGKLIRFEMRELFARYTSDVIASCAFGVKVNSMEDRTNELFMLTQGPLCLDSFQYGIRFFLIRLMPKLMRFLDFQLIPMHVKKLFNSLVIDVMVTRKERQIVRPDMINLLMQLRAGDLKHDDDDEEDELTKKQSIFATIKQSNISRVQTKRMWTDDEIVAQCYSFYLAGFDTNSRLMSFIAYELAVNPDVQQRLYEEIKGIDDELNGARLSYDTLSKMKYLEQVVSEGLRKWQPSVFTNRRCTKECEIDVDGKRILIEKGRELWFPIWSIQTDPKYYDDPEKFDPARFSAENKHKLTPGTFIPFGIGNRSCIGSRFVQLEMKSLFFHLLLNFNIIPYERTEIPLKMAKTVLSLRPVNGIHLEFKPRA